MDKKDELRLIETHEMQISKHFAVNFNKTLILKNGRLDEDGFYDDVTTDMVMKVFPTASGFFWGGTCIDEFFSYHIEDGIEQIQYVIHEVERGAEVYYYCWW